MLSTLKNLRGSREEGFTLVELLVVILIIGVLTAIAVPIFVNQQKQAYRASVKSDVHNTMTAVATYMVKNPTTNTLIVTQTGKQPATGDLAAVLKPVITNDLTTVEVVGKFNGYKVNGYNEYASEIQDRIYTYQFDSLTGKYSEGHVVNPVYTAPVGG